jgi:four helix bundle protein
MPEEDTYLVDSMDIWVSEPESSPVRSQSFAFSLEIIRLYKQLESHREYVVSKQLLRSGTSIGANIEEAAAAESRKDFVHKMNIALKEARETYYWLRLLNESDLAPRIDVRSQLKQANDLVRLLTAIVKTTRKNP